MFVRTAALCAAALLSIATAGAQGWGGYYIGLNIGEGWAETDATRTVTNAGYFAASSVDQIEAASDMQLDEDSLNGGAQFGMNWPLGEFVVAGFEIDAQGFGNDTSDSATVDYSCCALTGFTTTTSLEQTWFTTARLRLGIANEWIMAYATGGFAGADATFTQTFSDTFAPVPLQTIESSEFLTGYAVGGGVEVMIESGASIKIEYLYLDLGEMKSSGAIALDGSTSEGLADVTDQVARVGMNFKLN
jgi:outer membrane immunogenic protein